LLVQFAMPEEVATKCIGMLRLREVAFSSLRNPF
jgi:hypothetical protein